MVRTDEFNAELEKIHQTFGKSVLTFKEIQQYTGRGYVWCSNHLNVPHTGCTAVQLAKALTALR